MADVRGKVLVPRVCRLARRNGLRVVAAREADRTLAPGEPADHLLFAVLRLPLRYLGVPSGRVGVHTVNGKLHESIVYRLPYQIARDAAAWIIGRVPISEHILPAGRDLRDHEPGVVWRVGGIIRSTRAIERQHDGCALRNDVRPDRALPCLSVERDLRPAAQAI